MIHSFYVKVASYIAISVRAKANANLVNQIIKSLMDFVGVKGDILTIKNNARNAPKIVWIVKMQTNVLSVTQNMIYKMDYVLKGIAQKFGLLFWAWFWVYC